jgi:hypothetical protein
MNNPTYFFPPRHALTKTAIAKIMKWREGANLTKIEQVFRADNPCSASRHHASAIN